MPRRRHIWFLAVAETIVWAGMYYLFPALLLRWESDLGWSKAELTAALTVALVISACCAPFTGRLIDRGHGRMVLTGGAVAGGLLIGGLAFVDTRTQFISIWAALGVAMSGCLYEPCFAFITRVHGLAAKRPITLITLVAGFAGTLSFPLANAVAELAGWRVSALTFAGLILVVAVPLFWLGARGGETAADVHDADGRIGERRGLGRALAMPVFWFLVLSFSALSLNHGALVTHLLPLLDERGVPAAMAVLAASLLGPMQVAGRVAMVLIDRFVSTNVIFALSIGLMVCATASLYMAGAAPPMLLAFVALQGAGVGITSIARPVVTAALLGRRDFGVVAGAIAMFSVGAIAAAPSLGTLIWSFGGYDSVLFFAFALALLALLAFALALLVSRGR